MIVMSILIFSSFFYFFGIFAEIRQTFRRSAFSAKWLFGKMAFRRSSFRQSVMHRLLQNPQLAYALLQAQIVMKIVDPQVAMVCLLRGRGGWGVTEARNMLLQNPQLAYALLQAQIVMKIVDPQVAMVCDLK